MAINSELLLFIEPKEKPSNIPIIDELTKKMSASLRKAKKGTIRRYSVMGQGYEFNEGDGWCGWHNCSCGANAGGHDFLLSNGEMTNANCIHYLAYHRKEISQEQLDRVANLGDGQETPDSYELERGREEWVKLMNPGRSKKAMTRQEYLDGIKQI
jgi:hypothetical protein